MNGIWVRTQDRNRILFCDCFRIEENVNKKCNIMGGELGMAAAVELGTYKTKENAMIVMDMIQTHIELVRRYDIVCQMPLDSEVK